MEAQKEELLVSTVGFFPNNIKKANQLIHSKFKLNTLQQKILFLALAKARMNEEENLVTAEISVTEVKKYTGINSNSIYDRARDAAINLATLYILNENPSNNQFEVQSGIIDNVKYDNGTMYFKFGQKYNSLVYNIKSNYTMLNKDIYMSLNSGYSLRLYEILKAESYKGDVVIKEMSIGDIKLSLGMIRINDKMQAKLNKNSAIDMDKLIKDYADKDLAWASVKKTLDGVITEINEKTDIHVEQEQLRTGKGGRVTGLAFTITKKEVIEEPQKNLPKKEKTEEEIDELIDEVKDIIDEKIKTKDCKTLLKIAEYNVGRIKEKYEILKKNSTKIENVVGWLIKAIEEDYQEPIAKEPEKAIKKNNFHFEGERDYSQEELDEIERWKLGIK